MHLPSGCLSEFDHFSFDIAQVLNLPPETKQYKKILKTVLFSTLKW